MNKTENRGGRKNRQAPNTSHKWNCFILNIIIICKKDKENLERISKVKTNKKVIREIYDDPRRQIRDSTYRCPKEKISSQEKNIKNKNFLLIKRYT